MKNKQNRTIIILFFLLLLFSCFQNATIVTLGSFSLKVSHVVALFGMIPLARLRKIILPPKKISIFVAFIVILSIFAYMRYGFNSLILNYVFGYMYIVTIINLGQNIHKETVLKIIRTVAVIVMAATLIKIILNIQIFISFFRNPYNHPAIFTFFGGGVNLEATWIAMLGLSFERNKNGYLYLLLSFIISVLYASRVGIIGDILLFCHFIAPKVKKIDAKTIRAQIVALLFIGMGLMIANRYGLLNYIFERFSNIGNESGSAERIEMWSLAAKAFLDNPFGYGIGNALVGIRISTGNTFGVANIHNLFLQMLLDAGVIGLLFYSYIVLCFIIQNKNKLLSDPFVVFIFSYFLLSLIQFRGGDSILFIMAGFYLNEKNKLMVE